VRCLVLAVALALAGALPSLAQEAEPAAAASPAEGAHEGARAEAADEAAEPPVASVAPRRPSPFVSATYDSDGGPGVGFGVMVPVGSPRSVLRVAAGYSIQFAKVPHSVEYSFYPMAVIYVPQRRNVAYAYAGLFLEARPPASLRPYGGITVAIYRDYSKGRVGRGANAVPSYGDFSEESSHTIGRLVFGLLLGRGKRCPFVEVTSGRQAQIRVSGGVRF